MAPYRFCIALVLLCCSLAPAQPVQDDKGLLEKTQSFLDEVGKGMRKVGEKAEGLFGPGIGLGDEKAAAHTQERDVHEIRETGPTPLVIVSNEFGEIHIDTWENRVVQVNAKVIAGAESASVAEELSRSIDVRITAKEDSVQVRPVLPPDRHLDLGAVSMQANLYITVPQGANVVLDNFFGDTYVRGVGGSVALESQYGLVDLGSIGGYVKARVRGEFPLRAQGLKQGGTFKLHGTLAEFNDISGELNVNSFGGSVLVKSLQPESSLDVISESSSVRLILPTDAKPDLMASSLYGSIESELPLTQSEQGPRIKARHGAPDAQQRVDISATFGDVHIEFEGSTGANPSGLADQNKSAQELLTENVHVTPYTRLQIEAVRGDVVLEATDDPDVNISATRIAWVPSAKAQAALDLLPLRVQKDTDQVIVRTLVTGDLAALECSDYRVDLKIRYPRNMPITVIAEDGHTRISGNTGQAKIELAAGTITANDCNGPLELSNKNGGIRVSGGTASVKASARYADSYFERVLGPLDVTCVRGGASIDKPGGPVTVRGSYGNVRVLALDGIAGNFDILVEEGDLSVVLGEASYAELIVLVDQGSVDSAIPLDGRILGRNKASFRGYPRQGQYSMKLEAHNGDIILD